MILSSRKCPNCEWDGMTDGTSAEFTCPHCGLQEIDMTVRITIKDGEEGVQWSP